MKTIYKLFYLSIVFGLICFTACREKESEVAQQKQKPEPESLSKYFQFFNHERKGSFLFQSTGGYRSNSNDHAQTMEGHFLDAGGNQVKGGKIKMGSFELAPVNFPYSGKDVYSYRIPGNWPSSDRHAAKAVFGTTIDIKMEIPLNHSSARTEGNETAKTLSGSLYIPEEIEFLAPVYNEQDSSTFTMQAGLHIQWNVDDQNLKGVVICLEYSPNYGSNIIENGKKYPVPKYKFITNKDISEGYTVKKSDLEDFPNGCYVAVSLGRANYVTLKNGEDNYDVAAFTLREGEFKVKK